MIKLCKQKNDDMNVTFLKCMLHRRIEKYNVDHSDAEEITHYIDKNTSIDVDISPFWGYLRFKYGEFGFRVELNLDTLKEWTIPNSLLEHYIDEYIYACVRFME
ncbi:MAG: hypothetical protein ACRCX8_19620 [Sarcina sp.]